MGLKVSFNLNGSFAGPYYLIDVMPIMIISEARTILKNTTIDCYDYFNWGIDVNPVSEFESQQENRKKPHVTNYRMTLVSEVIKDFLLSKS
ncbi:MAG: hypothetical protein IPL53_17040 [Ignavibacteria bacterium]|nr:hypothetical protein [Ignavibacteria bacterium]